MGGLYSTPLFRSSKIAVNNNPLESVLPIYYTKEELTQSELEAVIKVWGLITSSRAQTFVHSRRLNPQFGFSNCSEYFYELFYEKLLETHPGAKVLFKKNNKRMRQYFIGSFTMLLDSVNDVEKFTRSLVSLAHVHNNIGVKALEYGVVGEVIMNTIHRCCGDEFTDEAKKGWVKVFSRMFDIILPIVVKFEMKACGSLMTTTNGPRPGTLTISVNSNNECQHSRASSIRSTGSNQNNTIHNTCPVEYNNAIPNTSPMDVEQPAVVK